MKFAHLADCHVGSWRDPKLKDVSANAFSQAIDISMEKKVDFVLIAGDLFNTSFPSVDGLRTVVKKLSELRKKEIPVYLIAGSHDYSPSGRTMLDVLEEAGLCINVTRGHVNEDGMLQLKFTIDKNTGAKITGILGKAGTLDKKYYENLNLESLEHEQGFKIFMFHTAISEYRPDYISEDDACPLSFFPKGFDYYAGGHVHYILDKDEPGYGRFTYPGPLFPNNFSELEDLGFGGFYIYDDGDLKRIAVKIFNVVAIDINAENLKPNSVESEIKNRISRAEVSDSIILLRVHGRLLQGNLSEINFKEITEYLYSQGAYFVMRNTSKLTGAEFESIKIDTSRIDDIEEALIKEHLEQIKLKKIPEDGEMLFTKRLMKILSEEKVEGETKVDFETRISENMNTQLTFE